MTTGNPVLQSGFVTPGHLAAWTTDGVVQDAGFALATMLGKLASGITGINFNSANTDNPIPILLPTGYTRYRVEQIIVSGATASLTSATCGVFTASGAGGVAVVTSTTALTISSTSADTNNNAQSLSINDQNTMVLSDGALFFRVQSAEGVSAQANVMIFYQPLP